jgi:hypothetical protein
MGQSDEGERSEDSIRQFVTSDLDNFYYRSDASSVLSKFLLHL